MIDLQSRAAAGSEGATAPAVRIVGADSKPAFHQLVHKPAARVHSEYLLKPDNLGPRQCTD
jgi:hypothetical protein